MTCKIFSEEKLSQAGQKTSKVLVKNLFTQAQLTVLNIKKNLSKFSIEMFIKRTTTRKSFAYRMLLSFKTSVTFFLTSRRTVVSVVKRLSSNITRFIVGHCPMVGASIQACLFNFSKIKEYSYFFACSFMERASYFRVTFF